MNINVKISFSYREIYDADVETYMSFNGIK